MTDEAKQQGIRVRPAEFARMAGVSRQAVSKWIAEGKIKSIFPDGKIDPARAAKEVVAFSDPTRLRAKLFKTAASDVASLQLRVSQVETELEAAMAEIAELRYQADFDEIQWYGFRILLLEARVEVRAAAADEQDYVDVMNKLAIRSEELAQIAIEEVDENDDDLQITDTDLSDEALKEGLVELNRMSEELQRK